VGGDRFQAGSDQIGLVSLEAVQAEAFLVGEHRDRADAQFGGRTENPDRDFAAIGDQQGAYAFHGESKPRVPGRVVSAAGMRRSTAARMPLSRSIGDGGHPGTATSTGITLATRPQLA